MSFQDKNEAYPVGQPIQVECSNPEQSNLKLSVIRHAEAWTSSCGMVVEKTLSFDQTDQPCSWVESEKHYLKLFDRRHVNELRYDNTIGLWGQHRERAFIEGISNGNVGRLLYRLLTEPDYFRKTESYRDYADDEAFLWNECIASFHRERKIYSVLSKYQGDLVPLLNGVVTLDVRPPNFAECLPEGMLSLFQARGLLLEHLEGFSLADVTSHAPQSSWQGIFDKAINIVRVLDGEDILNRNLGLDDFIVMPQEDGEYRVCMADLSRCQIRKDDESDAGWVCKKWFAAEEDSLAGALKNKLEENGEFVLEFEPSLKYTQVWEKDEENESK